MNLVKTVYGSSENRDMGRRVRIKSEVLESSGGVEMHYIYYNSIRPESRLKNKFFIGLLTIWRGEREIDTVKMAAQVVKNPDGTPLMENGFIVTE
jgi:hypothetical protein